MRIIAFCLSLTLFLVSCRGPGPSASGGSASAASDDGGLEIVLVLPSAPTVGPAELSVRVLEGGDPVEGAEVEVTGDMTHAGMTPVIADAPEEEPGRYRTTSFEFSMAGDWVVTADVSLDDGRSASAEAATTVRRP